MIKRDIEEKIVSNLKTLKPGFQPFDIFLQLCRITVTPVVEVLPLRKVNGIVEVLLTKRDEDDIFWPGKYHIPGVVLLATDEAGSLRSAFKRILDGELGGVKTQQSPFFVDFSFREEKRGMGLSLLHWVELRGKTKLGEWFNWEKLPDTFLETQGHSLRKLVVNYLETKD